MSNDGDIGEPRGWGHYCYWLKE